MEKQRVLRVLVDNDNNIEVKGALPAEVLGKIARQMAEVPIDVLKRSLDDTLESVFDLIESSKLSSPTFSVSEMKFTLGLNASGTVSLLSVAEGGVTTTSSIDFTIVANKPAR